MMKSSSGIDMQGASDYKLMDRQVINALNDMPERITFYRAMSSWVGFKTTKLEFNVAPRMGDRASGILKSCLSLP